MAVKKSPAPAGLEPVLKEIGQGVIAPVYLVFGDDPYRVEEAFLKLAKALAPAGGDAELINLEAESTDIPRLVEVLASDSLFSGRKVVRVKHARLLTAENGARWAAKSRALHESGDQEGAVRMFLACLGSARWDLGELAGGGWTKVPDKEWKTHIDMIPDAKTGTWFNAMVETCLRDELTPKVSAETEPLERSLAAGNFGANCLLLSADQVDRRRTLFKAIAGAGRVIEFGEVKKWERDEILNRRATEVLSAAGKTISPDARMELGLRTGFNLGAYTNELEKLINYCAARKGIEKSDVEAVTVVSAEDSVFSLTDAIAARDNARALACLQDLLSSQHEPLEIFYSIARQVRLLLQARLFLDSPAGRGWNARWDYGGFQQQFYPAVRESQAANPGLDFYSMHPYRMFLFLSSVNRFGVPELLEAMERLLRADRQLKSSALPGDLVLQQLVIELCRRKAA